ncbi:hypothetical protein [Acinetobacter baumannii]|uniref:hypothetical protein n=1 Tax=Acinetobacter baumannii TaxID=470 RepID=UPI00148B3CB5|nr:hypothetical protein [Acinetobacter baumannii]
MVAQKTGALRLALARPFADTFWKPKSPRQDLVRAAALLIAEIERLDREVKAESKE